MFYTLALLHTFQIVLTSVHILFVEELVEQGHIILQALAFASQCQQSSHRPNTAGLKSIVVQAEEQCLKHSWK